MSFFCYLFLICYEENICWRWQSVRSSSSCNSPRVLFLRHCNSTTQSSVHVAPSNRPHSSTIFYPVSQSQVLFNSKMLKYVCECAVYVLRSQLFRIAFSKLKLYDAKKKKTVTGYFSSLSWYIIFISISPLNVLFNPYFFSFSGLTFLCFVQRSARVCVSLQSFNSVSLSF
jgi:hypothetical protein